MVKGNRKDKKAVRQTQKETGSAYSAARRQEGRAGLRQTQVQDKNGVLRTVYVRDDAGSSANASKITQGKTLAKPQTRDREGTVPYSKMDPDVIDHASELGETSGLYPAWIYLRQNGLKKDGLSSQTAQDRFLRYADGFVSEPKFPFSESNQALLDEAEAKLSQLKDVPGHRELTPEEEEGLGETLSMYWDPDTPSAERRNLESYWKSRGLNDHEDVQKRVEANLSQSDRDQNLVRPGSGIQDDRVRFFRNATEAEKLEVENALEARFNYEAKYGIRDRNGTRYPLRSRIKVADKNGNAYGVPIIEKDHESGAYLYYIGRNHGAEETGRFSSLRDAISAAAEDRGYEDSEYELRDWDDDGD